MGLIVTGSWKTNPNRIFISVYLSIFLLYFKQNMKSIKVNFVTKKYGRYQITGLCTKYLCLAFITLISVPKSSLSKHIIICDFDLFSKIRSHMYSTVYRTTMHIILSSDKESCKGIIKGCFLQRYSLAHVLEELHINLTIQCDIAKWLQKGWRWNCDQNAAKHHA